MKGYSRGSREALKDGQPVPATSGRSAPVLPWMRVPLVVDPEDGTPLESVGGLDHRLIAALHAQSIHALFPVQTVVWEACAGGASSLHDICLSAPTGSGKTLAYALPLIQALSRRQPLSNARGSNSSRGTSPRALLVLPTRDLAMQVYAVIEPLCRSVSLKAVGACRTMSLSAEAGMLLCADVAVVTPGRLVAHAQSTPGFDLTRLEFLVVDEADRLLRQGYQNWLAKVLTAIDVGTDQYPKAHPTVKFIVSATLTKDPSKLDRLGLRYPRYVAIAADDYRHKLPPGLKESKLVVSPDQKPYALVALLSALRPAPTLVFASSVETTRRLAGFLRSPSILEVVGRAVEYSAALPQAERLKAMDDFQQQRAMVLVCSDAMTRGMDIQGVDAVINYDPPVYVKTYVHRAGRTARAGRPGRVITLLRTEDVKHFKSMLRKADNTYVKDEKLGAQAIDKVREAVDSALAEIKDSQHDDGPVYATKPLKEKRADNAKGSRNNKKIKVTALKEISLL